MNKSFIGLSCSYEIFRQMFRKHKKNDQFRQSLQSALHTQVCSSAPFSHAESQQAAPRKARTSHMQGNLHVWFWPGTPVYCTNMCRSP